MNERLKDLLRCRLGQEWKRSDVDQIIPMYPSRPDNEKEGKLFDLIRTYLISSSKDTYQVVNEHFQMVAQCLIALQEDLDKDDVAQMPSAISTMQQKNPAAVALGRLGGLASRGKTSEKKRASSIANGKKGRRPKKGDK